MNYTERSDASIKDEQTLPYLIVELANAHGGSKDALVETIHAFGKIDYPNKGIKFQIFHADGIALPDFDWYDVYKKLCFEKADWFNFIELAGAYGDVWVDVFDTYGLDVIEEHGKTKITGLKLQASVLDNHDVWKKLESIELTDMLLVLNLSGYELSDIDHYIESFRKLKPKQLILQIGFQAYPTEISDAGLGKLAVLKAAYPELVLCIADHTDAESINAIHIPQFAVVDGCTYVEKHFTLDRSKAEYDAYSALEPKEMADLVEGLLATAAAFSGPFINDREAEYLEKSQQSPILLSATYAGQLLSIEDLVFKRTNQTGLTLNGLRKLQENRMVLSRPLVTGSVVSFGDYKKAKVGVIVACRMKSTRLKNKATSLIGGVSSIERCLENCLKIQSADEVILATSTLESDAVLKDHTLGSKVGFVAGDAEDVIKRYLKVCDEYNIDVIVRVTGDCPVVSSEIVETLLDSHFKVGADYTAAKEFAVGSSAEIINTEAIKRVLQLLGRADYSEYMTWYFVNNRDLFKVNIVDLPPNFVRDYRLTLDYEQDLEMFNALFDRLKTGGMEPTIQNIFKILDNDSAIPKINGDLTLTYKTDRKLIELLNEKTRIIVKKR